MQVPDQRPVWDKKHESGDHEMLRHTPSPLAELAEPYFSRQANILELGCGVGRDAELFALMGHTVLATDGSEVVINQNRVVFNEPNIEFKALDMRQPLPYEADSFDVVYANLSLHYYDHSTTASIIQEINRVLKEGGIFAFACKSFDSLHTEGSEIEENIYASPSGASIHLFSLDYAQELIDGQFKPMALDEISEEFNGRYSKIVRCIANKLPK